MAPLLLNHLARSLTHQLAQMTRFSLSPFSATTGIYRCLSTLTSAPFRRLVLPGRVNYMQAPLPARCGTPLLGQCQQLARLQPSAGMKTKSAIKRRCKDCFIVRRRGHLYVICKTNPRHKQRQG